MKITKNTSNINTVYKKNRKLEYIIIHYTAGVTSRSGTANNTALWFRMGQTAASSDFIVDDENIIQYNADIKNRYTQHCGGVKYNNKGGDLYGIATNLNSIGIEVCSTNDTSRITLPNDKHWSFTDKVIDNTVELVKYLMKKYKIDSDHVIRHYNTTGKLCPGIIGWNADSGDESEWIKFKERISAKMYRIRTSWINALSQIGAYTNLDSAKEVADFNRGYKVYDEKGKLVYQPKQYYGKYKTIQNKVAYKNIPTTEAKTIGWLSKNIGVVVHLGTNTKASNGTIWVQAEYKDSMIWLPLKYLRKEN